MDGYNRSNANQQSNYQQHTGDPHKDMAYDRAMQGQGGAGQGGQFRGPPAGAVQGIPDEVVKYLVYFRRCVEERNEQKILYLYETGFPELSERYYRDKLWPDEEQVRMLLNLQGAPGDDPPQDPFIFLYKEMYYRFLYGKTQRGPSLEQRYNSYNNYQELFAWLLEEGASPRQLSLPNQWMWDIVDEFVYQLQSFCLFKSNPAKRNNEQMSNLIEAESQVWNIYPVLNILYLLIGRSKVNEQLAAMNAGMEWDPDPDEYSQSEIDFARNPLYFKFGYFALIGLLRLHILIGDYYQGLKCVDHLDFGPSALYNVAPNCAVTLLYFVGFARMMLREYQEAIRLFTTCLTFIQRTRNRMQGQPKSSFQYDIIGKTNDQLFNLLAICLALQPQRIDDNIHSQLMERVGDRLQRMKRGDIQEFESLFGQACPKFLCLTIANHADSPNMNLSREPTLQQTRIFIDEIQQQLNIPILRGYLKLYSTMPLSKLASFLDVKESELINMLLAFKHKMFQSVSTQHKLNQQQVLSSDDVDTSADIDFYIDEDMIHIADTKIARRYGEYFIRNITKLQDLQSHLGSVVAIPGGGYGARQMGGGRDGNYGGGGRGKRGQHQQQRD